MDEVQHKWKHLRNHFLREVKLVRAGKQHTKRKYIYYHDMEFMTPYVGIKPGRPRVKYNDSDDSDNSSSSPKELTKEQKLVINKFDGLKKISEKVRPLNPTSSTTITQVKNPIPSISMRDGDISFCLSLVPTMRKLEETKKLKAKIDILTILHKYVDADPPVKRAKVASNHSRTNHSNEREEHLFELEYASNIKQDATNDTDKNAENVWWT